jgi:hypothetical protein
MDVFAHFLWSVALFWQQRKRLLAGLYGVLPDLLSFGLLFVGELGHITGRGPPPVESLPSWLFVMYNITHSFVVWLALFGLVWLVMRKPPILLGAWGIHIICDVFTHTPAYFPTPVFWPLSDWVYVHGVSWAHPVFMAVNYGSLAVVYGIIVWHAYTRKKPRKV